MRRCLQFAVLGLLSGFGSVTLNTGCQREAVASCSPAHEDTSGKIAILSDDLPGFDRELVQVLVAHLRQRGFDVTELSASQVADPRTLSADKFFLYIIPNCRCYPATAIPALTSFASNRGHLFFVGGPFLDEPVWESEGRWFDRKAVLEAKRNAKPQHHAFPVEQLSVQGWIRTCSDRNSPGKWLVTQDGPDGKNCFKFWTENYVGWDGYASPVTPLFAENHDLFTFMAKGGPKTGQLAVEIQEQDGSRWIATTDIDRQWRRIGLGLDEFHFWGDSPTQGRRGSKGDQLRPAQAQRVVFQLAHSHTVEVPQGEHTFWIAEVGTCKNPAANMPFADPADVTLSLETVLPRFKVYPLASPMSLKPTASPVLAETDWQSTGNSVCTLPRTMGRGFDRGQKWRYLPMLDAIDSNGDQRGSPAWLLINRAAPFTGTVFACLGFNDTTFLSSPTPVHAVSEIASRLSQGTFFAEAGCEHFTYWPGEKITLGATVMNVGNDHQTVSVAVTLRDEHDKLVFQKETRIDVAAHEQARFQDSVALPDMAPAGYRIHAELHSNDTSVDSIDHEITVLDTSPAEKDKFITVRGQDFFEDGKKWYPVGVNYWPLYVSGMDRDDYWAGWIDRAFYEPELVEQDLLRMQQLGINLVSIQSHDPKFYRNLLDFLHRCHRHKIRVNLFCGLASPLGFRETELGQFIRQARLAQNPTIMAYDTIWEPGNYVFQGDRRKQWNADWRAWIREQYGSIESAESDWDFTARRDGAKLVISPPDRFFSDDGAWRTMVAAYRRFMDDLTSRKWNQAHRKLRQLDPNHLVSFRQGNTLPHDFVFTGTPKHIDFICPEGYAISANDDGFFSAGFITRYVLFTTRGKPVVWSEFGQSVWDPQTMAPSPGRIRSVADYHEMFYRMVLASGANGTIPWWWPGGYRVGERSDFGIANPDGTPRPAANLLTKYGPRLLESREWPHPTVWFDMDQDQHSGGYWYVCFNTGRDAFREAIGQHACLGIRTLGTGTTSANTPLVAVGNRPCTGHNPPKFLNAEFNHLRIRDASGRWVEARNGTSIPVVAGEPVVAQVSLGNTQEATWLAAQGNELQYGDVALRMTADSVANGNWSIPTDTPYLADADFGNLVLVDKIMLSARIELRMVAEGRAPFGETREFVLQPSVR